MGISTWTGILHGRFLVPLRNVVSYIDGKREKRWESILISVDLAKVAITAASYKSYINFPSHRDVWRLFYIFPFIASNYIMIFLRIN